MVKEQEKKAEKLLRDGLAALEIPLSDQQIAQLISYIDELLKWNKRVNLIAKNTSLTDVVEKHFLDSLTLLPVLERRGLTGQTFLDVGSGAGFPGLAVKIGCPSLSTVLLEPRSKRCSFLNHIIRLLTLENIEVRMERIEEDARTEVFSTITGRAVADIPTFLDMVSQKAGPGTLVICMQGEEGRKKWQEKGAAGGFVLAGTEEFILPLSGAKRFVLLFQKQA